MNGLNTFINNAERDTGVPAEQCDVIIKSMVKAVNSGALGGTSPLAQLTGLKKKKFTSINTISDIVTADTGYEREEVKKVVGWMVDRIIQTLNQGGMPALMRMANLMRKGYESQTKPVDYSDEIKDINEALKTAKNDVE